MQIEKAAYHGSKSTKFRRTGIYIEGDLYWSLHSLKDSDDEIFRASLEFVGHVEANARIDFSDAFHGTASNAGVPFPASLNTFPLLK